MVMIDHTEEMVQREHNIKRTLLGFAIVVLFAAVIWLAFARYV
jgi:hypothetical protein